MIHTKENKGASRRDMKVNDRLTWTTIKYFTIRQTCNAVESKCRYKTHHKL